MPEKRNHKLAAPQVMRFRSFTSPVDGSRISSPEQRREHNRRNDCVDVGNERPVRKIPEVMRPVKEDLIRELRKYE